MLVTCHVRLFGSPPGSSVCGILQARILEWVSYSLLQGIFPTRGLNLGLLLCRQILPSASLTNARELGRAMHLSSSISLFSSPNLATAYCSTDDSESRSFWLPFPQGRIFQFSMKVNVLIFAPLKMNTVLRASLVVQWLRIRLPMQGTWVWSLVQEDATSPRAMPQLLSLCSRAFEPQLLSWNLLALSDNSGCSYCT